MGEVLTRAISAEMVVLYAAVYGHDRTTARTYINDNVVVCILENILSSSEQELVAAGESSEVIDGRVAFQADRQDEFSAAVERLTPAQQWINKGPVWSHRRTKVRRVST